MKLEEILSEFDKKWDNPNGDYPTGKDIELFIRQAYLSGIEAENKAWLGGYRCSKCGKEMKPISMTDMCGECWENG